MLSRSPAEGMLREKVKLLPCERLAAGPATNLPRNTRLSTFTGKKKWVGDEIHRV